MFNVCKFSFNYEKNIRNWSEFADKNGEVIIACNTSEDNSYEELSKLAAQITNLKIIQTDIPYTNRFDGRIKTEALKECSSPVRILMDADEYIPKSNWPKWEEPIDHLMKFYDRWDGFLIPTIDLYGSNKTIRKNHNIGQKFRLHGNRIKSRGVIKFAELPGGYFDTSKSDNTEPLLNNGELGLFYPFLQSPMRPEQAFNLVNLPFTVHEGYLDLARKANHGKEFWKNAWENYSNHQENVATDVNQLENVEVIEHGLDIK